VEAGQRPPPAGSPATRLPATAQVAPLPQTSVPAAAAAPVSRAPQPSYVRAEITGGPFVAGRSYRLQVGAFRDEGRASSVFHRLESAGLKPAYERYGDLYRIVLVNIRGEDVGSVAITLGQAGFSEALARVEQ
jgi:cell division septation protein DedD